uniref:Uncharacterized protein n=1 Tax=Caenorhabditis tropicalis TaxID=1561998 RepID=A0A1I7UC08_9PELO
MGCTHSKNSKSKALKTKEQPLERPNHVAHFDETQPTTPSTSAASQEEPPKYTKHLLTETKESTCQKIPEKKPDTVVEASIQVEAAPLESVPHTAVPLTNKQYIASMYYPMPTEKHKSPEKKKTKKVEKRKEVPREKIAVGE